MEVENLIKLLKKNIPWNANNIIESKLLSHPNKSEFMAEYTKKSSSGLRSDFSDVKHI